MTVSLPAHVADTIRGLGGNWNAEVLATTRALYEPLVRGLSDKGVRIAANLAYGANPRQTLDIYRGEGEGRPVLVFVPGGGFQSGEKDDGVFYRNLGLYFAQRGYLTAIPDYRLAPQHPWPAGAEDVGAVIGYLRREAASLGGDPERIFAFGHSAGAAHIASYLFDPRFHPGTGAGVRAAALISGGGYRMDGSAPAGRRAYFGEDPAQWADRSPITHVGNSNIPLFIGIAEFDSTVLAVPSLELAQAVTLRDGRLPALHVFPGHNHISTVFSIGSPDNAVGGAVGEFFAPFS